MIGRHPLGAISSRLIHARSRRTAIKPPRSWSESPPRRSPGGAGRRGGPQQIENYILQPTIIGKAAQVSGFTVLTSVLAFGALFGLIGAIIGVPIAAGIQIVADELTAARRARIAAADAAKQQPA
jgi:hypothetical protein